MAIEALYICCRIFICSYDGNGQVCKDTDECALGMASCAQDAECKNTQGSFRCECKEGFTGDGEFCLGEYFVYLLSAADSF